MKKIFTTLIILFSFVANSQCIKGDCQNGVGTYKYVDEGTFEGVFKKGDAFKGVFTNTMFSEPIVFEGYFMDTDNGPVIDFTKKGKMIESNLEREGFITEIITVKDGIKTYYWKLNGKGEKKLALVSGDFRIYKGNFIEDILNDKNGEIIYVNGNKYLGEIVNGKRQGIGKIITPGGGIQNYGNWFENEWVDANKNNPNAVPIYYDGSSIMVDVDFNGTKIQMTLDTGASITSLNKYKFYSLVALGQIKIKNEQDGSFTIANGDVVKGKIYVINKMKIGSYEIKNVEFSVLEKDTASNLLGLNALLQPTNSIKIDINAGELSF
jgi:ribosomal protein L7Ae-like RNA K-turn-binding protein